MNLNALITRLFSLTRRRKIAILMILDIFALSGAFLLTMILRFDSFIVIELLRLWWPWLLVSLALKLLIFSLSGIYSFVWRYASTNELLTLARANILGSLALTALYVLARQVSFPLRILTVDAVLGFIFVGSTRIFIRLYRDHLLYKSGKPERLRVLIVGAGEAGVMVSRELIRAKERVYQVVGFVDDDRNKIKQRVGGIPVLGSTADLPQLVTDYHPDEIIIAMPSATGVEIRSVVEKCRSARITYRMTPSLHEILSGKLKVDQLRTVQIEDLLGREPVALDLKSISSYLAQKSVLVSGAGGSIGSEICRQVLRQAPRQLILLGHGENSIFDIHHELSAHHPLAKIHPVIADVTSHARMKQVFSAFRPEVIFHAAAHKHVPLMEDNAVEAIKNNVFGTRQLLELAQQFEVEKFVMISSDKAVNPTNVMGSTKRFAEMVLQSFADRSSQTAFMAVRFGNVLGSRGSVVPLFRRQIRDGGPVTVTHPDVVRYFMTIPEAVQLVVQAGAFGHGGEIFLLDMGQPVKIVDLAREMIRLSGLEPDLDMEIKFVGLRPGEKLFEELLLTGEDTIPTAHDKIFGAKLQAIDAEWLELELEWFEENIYRIQDETLLRRRLFDIIAHPRYRATTAPQTQPNYSLG